MSSTSFPRLNDPSTSSVCDLKKMNHWFAKCAYTIAMTTCPVDVISRLRDHHASSIRTVLLCVSPVGAAPPYGLRRSRSDCTHDVGNSFQNCPTPRRGKVAGGNINWSTCGKINLDYVIGLNRECCLAIGAVVRGTF